jgi:hypothetical protein
MVRALSNYLRDTDFPSLGTATIHWEPFLARVAALVNALPRAAREQVYIWSGRFEAISPRELSSVKLERVCDWVTSLYPKRRYPAVAVGSSNGAAIHLFAALGIPFIGVDTASYPRDFAVFVRYHRYLQRLISARHSIPSSLPLVEFDGFLREHSSHYSVRWK